MYPEVATGHQRTGVLRCALGSDAIHHGAAREHRTACSAGDFCPGNLADAIHEVLVKLDDCIAPVTRKARIGIGH
jgi:hypothetical protein